MNETYAAGKLNLSGLNIGNSIYTHICDPNKAGQRDRVKRAPWKSRSCARNRHTYSLYSSTGCGALTWGCSVGIAIFWWGFARPA
jgi:hypothetical protein